MAIPKTIKDGFFKIGTCIDSGGFGDVYQAKMKDGRDVAIKFELKSAESKFLLTAELEAFKELKGEEGFPKHIEVVRSISLPWNCLAIH